jgi:transcriptional regulator with XRE-family HTH domain
MDNFKQKISEITSSEKSKWKDFVRINKENPWLKHYSYKIAQTILYFIEKNKDLSQVKLANILDVKPQQINKIVKGKENLTLETIYKLSKALNVELIVVPDYEDISASNASSLPQFDNSGIRQTTESNIGIDSKIIPIKQVKIA